MYTTDAVNALRRPPCSKTEKLELLRQTHNLGMCLATTFTNRELLGMAEDFDPAEVLAYLPVDEVGAIAQAARYQCERLAGSRARAGDQCFKWARWAWANCY